jgi:hypothetical protein
VAREVTEKYGAAKMVTAANCFAHIEGSLKINKYIPGTLIPVVEESRMFEDQPDCAIIFSWHVAAELAPKLRAKGFKDKLITPLPTPHFL